MTGRVYTLNTRSIVEGARNGIALPILRVDGTDYNLKELSRAELIELAALLKADVDNIQYQRDSNHTGAWAKPGWEDRAIYAQRMKKVQIQLVQAELGLRKESVPVLSNFFMDEAWRVLAGDVFEAIMAVAKAKHKEAFATA